LPHNSHKLCNLYATYVKPKSRMDSQDNANDIGGKELRTCQDIYVTSCRRHRKLLLSFFFSQRMSLKGCTLHCIRLLPGHDDDDCVCSKSVEG